MTLIITASFSKGELAPSLHGRVDTAAYKIGLRTARNLVIHAYGGASNRAGLQFVGMCQSNAHTSRLRRFQFKTTDTYILEFGHLTMRVIRDDAHVREAAKAITGASSVSPAVLTVVGHGWSVDDAIEVNGIVGMTDMNARRFLVGLGSTADTVVLVDPITGGGIDGLVRGTYVSGGTAARVFTLATPYDAADLRQLKFVQSADVITITHRGYAPRELRRSSDTSWALTIPTFVPSIAAPGLPTIVNDTANSLPDSYQVTALATDTLEESLPSPTASTATSANPRDNTVSWAAVPGAEKYAVYKSQSGIFGFIGETPDTNFKDSNLAPAVTQTPPRAVNPFSSAGDYPGTASYFEQRRVFGGSTNRPDTAYYSQTGNQSNMSVSSPVQDDDAITATLTSRQVNEIRYFVPGNDLIVLTSGSEWRVNSGQDSAFAASTIRQKPQSAWGCSHLEPIVVGQTLLFVPEQAITVRSLGYTFQSDSYTGNDLSILSNHLFGVNKSIVAWAFGRSPDPVAYCVTSAGGVALMTFHQEQEVTAWSRWDTSGSFLDVDTVRPNPDDPDDAAYFVVRRQVNGHAVNYIERTHSRRFDDVRDCFFVDSGLSFDNPIAITAVTLAAPITIRAPAHGLANDDIVDLADILWVPTVDADDNETQPDQLNNRRYTVAGATTDTFTLVASDGTGYQAYASGGTVRKTATSLEGLDHLEGRTVVALVDGNAVADLVVTAGSVTPPERFSRAHVGLKYIADLETLNVEAPQGTIQGKFKKLAGITIRFEQSRGLFAGPDTANLDEIKQREFEAMDNPTELLTGDKVFTLGTDWEHNGRIFLRQRYPLPMTILAVIPDVQVSDQ